ncbi:hypothetical protein Abol_010_018 [Acetobacter orleanensis JCM 7639]|nr:hypothetical protein Abol_010_018 [Acetobacter orleanensis JCM 7639]
MPGATLWAKSTQLAAGFFRAGVVELVDTPDLGSGGASRGGSSPSARTMFFGFLVLPSCSAAASLGTMQREI